MSSLSSRQDRVESARIDVISTRPQFEGLRSDWEALAAGFASPLLSYDWYAACVEALGPDRELSIFVVRRGNRAEAIAPLMLSPDGPGAHLVDIAEFAKEPQGFLYLDQNALKTLIAALHCQPLPIRLPRMLADNLDFQRLKGRPHRALSLRDMTVQTVRGATQVSRINHYTASWVPLTADWPAFEASMSSASRSNLRRKRKAAERIGKVEFQSVAPKVADVATVVDAVGRVEASGWKGRSGTAIVNDHRLQRFVLAYARRAAAQGTLRVHFLHIGGDIAAARLAVVNAGRLWEIKVGYDERFAKCSPGILLTHETLRLASAEGLQAHEFLGGTEAWQRWWPTQRRGYASLHRYPHSILNAWTGGCHAASFVVDRATRFCRARMPWPQDRAKASSPSRVGSLLPHINFGVGG